VRAAKKLGRPTLFKSGAMTAAERQHRHRMGRAAPEHALHVAVARYLALALKPPTVWTSLDAGAGKMGAAAAGRRKARGVKPGWPDLLVMHHNSPNTGTIVLGIELKAGTGTASTAQKAIAKAFYDCDAEYVICRSISEVAAALALADIPLHARPA
jgi:hypothetical protein